MSKLTDKQMIFVNEYLVDLNATRAYKAAYPKVKKDEVANAAGSRMLRNVKVKEYIDKRMADREKRTEITQDNVLKELAAIAFANGSDFSKIVSKTYTLPSGDIALDEEGNPRKYQTVEFINTDKLTEDKKKAIAGIKEGKNGIEIKLNDKVRALELLGKHLGMFKDQLEIKGTLNNPFEGLTTEELLKIADDG